MRCEDIRHSVYVYLDEEFDEDDCRRFEEHLSACADCLSFVQGEELFRLRLRHQLRPVAAPEGLRERILDHIEHEEVASADRHVPGGRVHATHPQVGWRAAAGAVAVAAAVVSIFVSLPGWLADSHAGPFARSTNRATLSSMLGSPEPLRPLAGLLPGDPEELLINGPVVEHKLDVAPDVEGSRSTVEAFVRDRVGLDLEPPLVESAHTRLVGVRLSVVGTLPAVEYFYDHDGRRLTVRQLVLPASVDMRPGELLQRRIGGYNVFVFAQSESVLASLVTDLPTSEVRALVAGPMSH